MVVLGRLWSSGWADEGEPAPQAVWAARAEAWNWECTGHVEGTGPAGNVGDDTGGQAGLRLRRVRHLCPASKFGVLFGWQRKTKSVF